MYKVLVYLIKLLFLKEKGKDEKNKNNKLTINLFFFLYIKERKRKKERNEGRKKGGWEVINIFISFHFTIIILIK